MLITPVNLHDLGSVDIPVTAVAQCEVHLLAARHNAWHGNTTNYYTNQEPIFTDWNSAGIAAERRRKSGTYFEITQKPALAFGLIGGRSLVVTHLNTSRPFKSWVIPPSLLQHRSPILGTTVLHGFNSSLGLPDSGWPECGPDLTMILGTVESSFLTIANKRKFEQRISYVDAGEMYFPVDSRRIVSTTYIRRIIAELGTSAYERIRVHQLADQLQVKSSEVIGLLPEATGLAVDARSWVDVRTANKIRTLVSGNTVGT